MSLAGLISVAIALAGLGLLLLGLLLFRGRKRASEPTCPECRYALAGLPGVSVAATIFEPITCPECGHAARKRTALFRRQRRPIWLVVVLAGVLVTIEPLALGNARLVYGFLPDATIARLHANWSDPHARDIVERHIGVVVPQDNDFHNVHLGLLAGGAITRIERANVRHPGEPDRIDSLDLDILWHFHNTAPGAASTARLAKAMPPLFPLGLSGTWRVALMARDRHDPASTLPAALAAGRDADPIVRQAAAWCLFAHLLAGQDAAAGPFAALLGDENPEVRVEAAEALASRAARAPVPTSLHGPLVALDLEDPELERARGMGVLAALRGEQRGGALAEACRDMLREGADRRRWDTLAFVCFQDGLTATLLPAWDVAKQGRPSRWLADQRHRPIDEVLDELGFE